MDLEQIDVVRLEALQARVDLVEDSSARQPALVHVVALFGELWAEERHRAQVLIVDEDKALGQDDDFLARNIVLRPVRSIQG